MNALTTSELSANMRWLGSTLNFWWGVGGSHQLLVNPHEVWRKLEFLVSNIVELAVAFLLRSLIPARHKIVSDASTAKDCELLKLLDSGNAPLERRGRSSCCKPV